MRNAGDNAVGFFYYAGHGLALNQGAQNYLVTINVTELTSKALQADAIRLDEIIDTLRREAPRAAHFCGL